MSIEQSGDGDFVSANDLCDLLETNSFLCLCLEEGHGRLGEVVMLRYLVMLAALFRIFRW